MIETPEEAVPELAPANYALASTSTPSQQLFDTLFAAAEVEMKQRIDALLPQPLRRTEFELLMSGSIREILPRDPEIDWVLAILLSCPVLIYENCRAGALVESFLDLVVRTMVEGMEQEGLRYARLRGIQVLDVPHYPWGLRL